MKPIYKLFAFTLFLFISGCVYAQSSNPRDVAYTQALYNFIDAYYNNKINDTDTAQKLYEASVSSAPEDYDDYQMLVHLARCEFYLGMYVMGEYDFSGIQQIKSMVDTTDRQKDLSEQIKAVKAKAGSYFDKCIEYAQQALKVRSGADAYLIYAMAISSNCTVKTSSYVIGNGLKVASFSKKALALDPYNATACYYQYAQDLYAPAFFANYKRGYQKMYQFYNDENLRKEKNDIYFFITGIAYSYYKRGMNSEAVEWYKESLKIYPDNTFALKMITTLTENSQNEL